MDLATVRKMEMLVELSDCMNAQDEAVIIMDDAISRKVTKEQLRQKLYRMARIPFSKTKRTDEHLKELKALHKYVKHLSNPIFKIDILDRITEKIREYEPLTHLSRIPYGTRILIKGEVHIHARMERKSPFVRFTFNTKDNIIYEWPHSEQVEVIEC
jgi:hypothetical protein